MVDLDGGAGPTEDLGDGALKDIGGSDPHGVVPGAQGSPKRAEDRDHVGGVAGVHGPEHQLERARLTDEAVDRRLKSRDQLAEDPHEIDGETGSGRVAARTAEPYLDHVGSRGQRPDPAPDLSDVDLGVAVQPEHPDDPLEPALGDDVDSTPGHGLLRRLEDESDRATHTGVRAKSDQRPRGADEDRRVYVVPARMRDPVHGRSVGDVLVVLHRQGIEVRAQSDDRTAAVPDRDVTDQAGAGPQQGRCKPELTQQPRHQIGGAVLVAAQLGVGVQSTTEDDQQLVVRGDHGVELPWNHPAILGRRRHGPQPTRRCHPFGRAGPPGHLPNYIDVTRLRRFPRTDATTEVMALLRDRVPLTLLMDLLDPAGPRSRQILLAELVTDDVRRDAEELRAAHDRAETTDYLASQEVC